MLLNTANHQHFSGPVTSFRWVLIPSVVKIDHNPSMPSYALVYYLPKILHKEGVHLIWCGPIQISWDNVGTKVDTTGHCCVMPHSHSMTGPSPFLTIMVSDDIFYAMNSCSLVICSGQFLPTVWLSVGLCGNGNFTFSHWTTLWTWSQGASMKEHWCWKIDGPLLQEEAWGHYKPCAISPCNTVHTSTQFWAQVFVLLQCLFKMKGPTLWVIHSKACHRMDNRCSSSTWFFLYR